MKLRYKDEKGKDHEMHIKYFSTEMFKVFTWQMVAGFTAWIGLVLILFIIGLLFAGIGFLFGV